MNTTVKATIASLSAFAVVGAVVIGSFAFAEAVAPRPVVTVTPEPVAEIEPFAPAANAAGETASRLGVKITADAESALAATVRAQLEASAAAGDCSGLQASFDRAEINGNTEAMIYIDQLMSAAGCYDVEVDVPAPSDPEPVEPSTPVVVDPPAPEPSQPGGDQQAGECREYNDNNECTGWYVP